MRMTLHAGVERTLPQPLAAHKTAAQAVTISYSLPAHASPSSSHPPSTPVCRHDVQHICMYMRAMRTRPAPRQQSLPLLSPCGSRSSHELLCEDGHMSVPEQCSMPGPFTCVVKRGSGASRSAYLLFLLSLALELGHVTCVHLPLCDKRE
eukprot:2524260-Prymnesium_polylepis.3